MPCQTDPVPPEEAWAWMTFPEPLTEVVLLDGAVHEYLPCGGGGKEAVEPPTVLTDMLPVPTHMRVRTTKAWCDTTSPRSSSPTPNLDNITFCFGTRSRSNSFFPCAVSDDVNLTCEVFGDCVLWVTFAVVVPQPLKMIARRVTAIPTCFILSTLPFQYTPCSGTERRETLSSKSVWDLERSPATRQNS